METITWIRFFKSQMHKKVITEGIGKKFDILYLLSKSVYHLIFIRKYREMNWVSISDTDLIRSIHVVSIRSIHATYGHVKLVNLKTLSWIYMLVGIKVPPNGEGFVSICGNNGKWPSVWNCTKTWVLCNNYLIQSILVDGHVYLP